MWAKNERIHKEMEVIDIIILVITLASLVCGFWRGFVVQAGAIAGVVVGILACQLFGDSVAVWIGDVLPTLSDDPVTAAFINKTIAYIILFLLCYGVVRLLASLIKSLSSVVLFGIFDRILGALFTLFQSMLVLSMILSLIKLISSESTIITGSTLANGHAIQAILDLGPSVLGLVL